MGHSPLEQTDTDIEQSRELRTSVFITYVLWYNVSSTRDLINLNPLSKFVLDHRICLSINVKLNK